MKKMLIVLTVLLVGVSFVFAGSWDFTGAVMNGYSVATNDGAAGVNLPGLKNLYTAGVDPDGKVWVGTYYSRRLEDTDGLPDLERYPDLWYEITEQDTGTGAYLDTVEIWNKPIFVWDPVDESIDTIRFLVYPGGGQDTITTHRGMARSYDGNMIYASDAKVWKVNYQTHEVIATWDFPAASQPLQQVVCDDNGYVYVTGLWGGIIYILDPDDLSEYAQATTAAPSTRGGTVSSDGMHVYATTGLAGAGVIDYYSADGPDGTYAALDTVAEERSGSGCAMWDPAGYLWITECADATGKTWSFDPANAFVPFDTTSLSHPLAADTTDYGYPLPEKLRCVRDYAFNVAGDKLYLPDFYGYTLKEYTYIVVGVDNEVSQPNAFSLSQNYPNPFNPTTVIQFTLAVDGAVKLTVYDITGRMVATLINQPMNAGSHVAEFDGSRMASGSYFYELVVDGQKDVRKMMLIK